MKIVIKKSIVFALAAVAPIAIGILLKKSKKVAAAHKDEDLCDSWDGDENSSGEDGGDKNKGEV